MRTPREAVNLAQGIALPVTGTTAFDRFPLGEGYEAIRLTILATLTHGTGTTPHVLGNFANIRNVRLLTGKNEQVCDCPGLGLYLLNYILHGTEPFYDPILAATGAYRAVIDIPFNFPMLQKPEDCYLDSAQYNKLSLAVDTGALTDFETTPGTETVTCAMDISILQSKAAMLNRQPIVKGMDLSKLSRPIYVPYIRHLPTQNPTTTPFINIEISDDLYLLGIILFSEINNAGLVPYFQPGVPSHQLLNVSFGDNFVPNYMGVLPPMHFMAEAMQRMYTISPNGGSNVTPILNSGYGAVGIYPHFFAQPVDGQGSIRERYWTGGKSQVQISWTAAGGANPSVDCLLFGFRKMRP